MHSIDCQAKFVEKIKIFRKKKGALKKRIKKVCGKLLFLGKLGIIEEIERKEIAR